MYIDIHDKNIYWSGRWKACESSCRGAFQGYAELHFNGTSIAVDGKGDVYIETDDGEPLHCNMNGQTFVKDGLEKGIHKVRVYAAAQCTFPEIYGFMTDGESVPYRPKKQIEFIGDSIMEGYCDPSDKCEKYGNNGTMISYAAQTGKMLSAKYDFGFNLIAYGGISVAQKREGRFDYMCMPERYLREREFIVGEKPHEPEVPLWETDRYVPDHIVINLGTNDYAVSAEEFKESYIGFIKMLKATYPGVRVFVMTPFCAQKAPEIRQMLEANKDAELIDSAAWGIPNGSRDVHPSPASHIKAAGLLFAELEKRILQ